MEVGLRVCCFAENLLEQLHGAEAERRLKPHRNLDDIAEDVLDNQINKQAANYGTLD